MPFIVLRKVFFTTIQINMPENDCQRKSPKSPGNAHKGVNCNHISPWGVFDMDIYG